MQCVLFRLRLPDIILGHAQRTDQGYRISDSLNGLLWNLIPSYQNSPWSLWTYNYRDSPVVHIFSITREYADAPARKEFFTSEKGSPLVLRYRVVPAIPLFLVGDVRIAESISFGRLHHHRYDTCIHSRAVSLAAQ